MGDGHEPVQPSSPFFTANGVLYHSGFTVVVERVVDVVVDDDDVDSFDVEAVVVEVSVDERSSGMTVSN